MKNKPLLSNPSTDVNLGRRLRELRIERDISIRALAEQSGLNVNTLSFADNGGTPIVHTGLEFVFCLEGCVGYEVNGQAFTLDPGDSLLFEAHLPHLWRNSGNTLSRSLLLLCPSDERDHPDERHFTK